MDDKSKTNAEIVGKAEIQTKSSSSSSDEFELVSPEKNENELNPVLFDNNNISTEDLLNDAIASTPSMIVGKSIFYDCDEEIQQESTDEGLFFVSFVIRIRGKKIIIFLPQTQPLMRSKVIVRTKEILQYSQMSSILVLQI